MQSFTQKVKTELIHKQFPSALILTLLAGFIKTNGELITTAAIQRGLYLRINMLSTARFILSHLKPFTGDNIDLMIQEKTNFNRQKTAILIIRTPIAVFEACHLSGNGELKPDLITNVLTNETQARAYLAGVFLASGSINAPTTSNYHLELVVSDQNQVDLIKKLGQRFGLEFHDFIRKNNHLLYLKRVGSIADFLKVIDVPTSLFAFEDNRIQREITNSINRWNNIDLHNEQKILVAAEKQIEAIKALKQSAYWVTVKPNWKILANLRLEHPDASINDLNTYFFTKTHQKISNSSIKYAFSQLIKWYHK